MTFAPDLLYLNHPEYLLLVFDLRQPGAMAALLRQRARWAEYSDMEALDDVHIALIVRPGWVSEPAA